MLSRAGSSRSSLVCSDCGTPVVQTREPGRHHPVSSSLLLLAMAAFAVLLFFLTNWKPVQRQSGRERTLIKQVTTGQFVRDPELLDKGGHSEADDAEAGGDASP